MADQGVPSADPEVFDVFANPVGSMNTLPFVIFRKTLLPPDRKACGTPETLYGTGVQYRSDMHKNGILPLFKTQSNKFVCFVVSALPA